MEKLVETLGITRLSKSQVSVIAAELDEQVESFRSRPLDAGPYAFVAADALVLKVREGGRVVGVGRGARRVAGQRPPLPVRDQHGRVVHDTHAIVDTPPGGAVASPRHRIMATSRAAARPLTSTTPWGAI
jgi:predicted ATPase